MIVVVKIRPRPRLTLDIHPVMRLFTARGMETMWRPDGSSSKLIQRKTYVFWYDAKGNET